MCMLTPHLTLSSIFTGVFVYKDMAWLNFQLFAFPFPGDTETLLKTIHRVPTLVWKVADHENGTR